MTITPPSVNSKLIFKLEHYRISLPLAPPIAQTCDNPDGLGDAIIGNTAATVNCIPFAMDTPHAAGALCSTVGNLLIWDQALYSERLASACLGPAQREQRQQEGA